MASTKPARPGKCDIGRRCAATNGRSCAKGARGGKDPKSCTPAQIKKCHGSTKKHPCKRSLGT